MFDIGRICVKISGRDAGMKCIIIDVIDSHYVIIDGQTRRRKCNVKHLEPTEQLVKVTKNAPRPEIIRVFKELKLDVAESKPKKKAERPKKIRKKKEKPARQLEKDKKTKPASKEKTVKQPSKKKEKLEKKEIPEKKDK